MHNMTDIADYITRMPKAELHVHIEGAIEAQTLFAIADRNGIKLPFKTADDILASQSAGKSDSKQNLDSFIECLDVCRGVLRTGQDYHDIAYEYLKCCRKENIVYSEIMFDPQQGIRQGVKLEVLLEGLFSGAQSGNRDFGVEAQWIMNFQRDWPVEDAMRILDQASPYRHHIIGIGLDNPETPGFPSLFEPLFSRARAQGHRLTSHCDVHISNSIEHVKGCINLLGVERIDHGLNSIEDDEVVALIIEKQIHLTGCPTRYAFQPTTSVEDLNMMTELLSRGVSISLNSDDPAQFGSGWLTQTMVEAQSVGGLSFDTMTRFMRNGFLAAWLPVSEKARYLEQFDDANIKLKHEIELNT